MNSLKNYTGNKIIAGVCAIGLCAAAFTGCNKADEMKTVITSEPISTPNLVQQTMVQTAGNGKTYSYFWEAENIDAALEKYEKTYKDELNGAASASVSGGLDLKYLDEELKFFREQLEKEYSLSPAVSAQEAANIMGTVIEVQYGLNLNESIKLNCFQSDSDMFYHIDGGAPMRTTWGGYFEIPNGTWFPTSVSLSIDAFTGEIVSVSYILGMEEYETANKTEIPPCITTNETGNSVNTDDASFKPIADDLKANITKALNGSLLLGGADIAGIELKTKGGGNEKSGIWIDFTTTDNKEGTLSWVYPNPNYDFEGYPLRAFHFYNLSYLK